MSTKYPKISGKLQDFLVNMSRLELSDQPTTIPLIGTVKLHGAHADIVVHADDSIQLQSRNVLDLKLENDSYGYAAFMLPLRSEILGLRDRYYTKYMELNPGHAIKPEHPLIIAGEWIGVAIQKGVAIASLSKRFVIISTSINDTWLPDASYGSIHNESVGIYNISRAGFYYHALDLNDVQVSMDAMQIMTNEVEKACPFAKTFGISGVGEGIVWKATTPTLSGPDFWIKTKGSLHRVTNSATLPKETTSLEQKERAAVFARAIVTEMRLEQGWEYLAETGVEQSKKGAKAFLDWILQDCGTEEKREIEEMEIDLKLLRSGIVSIGREWYSRHLDEEKMEGKEKATLSSLEALTV